MHSHRPSGFVSPWRQTLQRLLRALLLLALLATPLQKGLAAPQSQLDAAQTMLEQLSPQERVGQIFLVTFSGTDISETSQIFDLLTNRHIGGAILLAANDNLTAEPNTIDGLLSLNQGLQQIRWAATQEPRIDPATGASTAVHFIPLFIGIPQEGGGFPNDEVLSGLTSLPNEMAIGATWDAETSAAVGNVLGKELSNLGVNLLLGPSLDVLESPRLEDVSDLGVRSFGGDPFWVSEMGSAYIRGVHEGSSNRIAVIAKHFPGNGGADRAPEEEVATVRKSFDELKNFDLAPFFTVTGNAPSDVATADGLLASHIRYQGFQENIRSTTRPVSFDPQAFSMLMGLPALSTWRENGGLMVSDSLGSQAVRRFYELTGQTFDARRVALNAFLAGNDLLYLGDIRTGEDPDNYSTIIKILDFFTQKYREDPTFAEKVNESVLRILRLKYQLYPSFAIDEILPPTDGLAEINQSSQVAFEVARKAATLISPTLAELNDAIPDPPNQNDRIIFFTDSRSARQCTQCALQPVLEVDALEQAVVRLYGPQAGSQILPASLISYSFKDLLDVLDAPETSTQLETDLRRAHWIVFATLNQSPDIPASMAMHRFLSERPDLFQQKRLIVFAFNAPYYLDATNISKISAYYGLYSKGPGFIDVAARLLFRELLPNGALPVSVPGIGYDLITATSPNPAQIIPLYIDSPQGVITGTLTTPAPVAVSFQLGDTISVRTGIIQDHNGHPVPDNTPVQFILSINGEGNDFLAPVNTRGGVAQINIQLSSSGKIEIRAESEPAKQSEVLRIEIPTENGAIITITPSPIPTATATPTPTRTPPPPASTATMPTPPSRPNLVDWLMAMMLSSILAFTSYRLSALVGQVRWGIRAAFLALSGGLLFYSYLALEMPGSRAMIESLGSLGILLTTLAGCALGIAAAWSWRYLRANRKSS